MADYLLQDHAFPSQPKPAHRNNTGKFFCSSFLLRLLLIALFLCGIPLLTSEAPDPISHTVFAKSWELVHLFIIGIIVSYGLFGRRTTQTQIRTQPPHSLDSPNLLHASAIFNFEHQNPSGYAAYGNGFGNVNQAFDSRPYGVEPTVVVRPGTRDIGFEPLDLPVRSLRSMVEESDSEEFARESEADAEASSNCCSEEENGSVPSPWSWPNSSPYVGNSEAKQACYETVEPSLSAQSYPVCSSSSELPPSMDVEVESSWSGPTGEENVLNYQPFLADLKEGVSGSCFVREFQEVKHVKTRSHRVSSSKGSSPFSPSLSDSPPVEVEKFSRVETVDLKLPTLPTPSLKSRSMRMTIKDKVADEPHSQVFSSEFSPLCSVASRSPTIETDNLHRDSERHHLQSSKPVSPMSNFTLPCAVSDLAPTLEMENLQTEAKKVDILLSEIGEGSPLERAGSRSRRLRKRDRVKGQMKSRTDILSSESSSCDTKSTSSHHFASTAELKQSPDIAPSKQVEIIASKNDFASSEISEDHTFSPFIQDGDLPLKKFGTRSQRSRKRDSVKGELKSRTDRLRNESSSCSAASEDLGEINASKESPLSTSSHHATSTIQPKQSPEVSPSEEGEINASKKDFVLATESSKIQFSSSSLLNKDATSSSSSSTSSCHVTSPIEPKQSPEIGPSTEVETNASNKDSVLATESSRIELGSSSSLNTDERNSLSRTSHSRGFSIGCFFDRDKPKEITKKVKDESRTRSHNSGKCGGWDCLNLDVKPMLTKNSLRGKSVRTVRPQAITLETGGANEATNKQKTDERVRERQDVVIISIGISEKSNGRNQTGTSIKNEIGESSSLEVGKKEEMSASVLEDVNEEEDCISEIDRKADEFIAKFKEQIRLQKVASRRVPSKH